MKLAAILASLLLVSPTGAGPGTAAGDSGRLLRIAEQCRQRAERIRGIRARRPIRWKVASRDEILQYVLGVLKKQYAPGELEAEGKTLQALELVAGGIDYRGFMLDLLKEQIGGVYDPVAEIFYLADWLPEQFQETIIVHEVTHALQDQAYQIDDFLDRKPGNSDAMLARSAVAEGEATLVMMIDAMQQAGTSLGADEIAAMSESGSMLEILSKVAFPSFSSAPPAIRKSLMFPYLKGLRFVASAKKKGGWKAMDRVYADLPRSTEQILHPEKYLANRDEPTEVRIERLDLSNEWKRVNEDVLGEFGMGLLLEPLDEDERQAAAAGWDGDRLLVYEKGKNLAWISLSVWDSERDATEFAASFAKAAMKRHPKFGVEVPDGKTVMILRGDGKTVWIERSGAKVVVLHGFAYPFAKSLRDSVLGATAR
ncbi:MAG: hypothetical protein D6806_14530 [Deltaproteobacteria bacterium]|nr:MAG: hypothetical protein D6806_14530 [Deltaproteobacteria bacterium]